MKSRWLSCDFRQSGCSTERCREALPTPSHTSCGNRWEGLHKCWHGQEMLLICRCPGNKVPKSTGQIKLNSNKVIIFDILNHRSDMIPTHEKWKSVWGEIVQFPKMYKSNFSLSSSEKEQYRLKTQAAHFDPYLCLFGDKYWCIGDGGRRTGLGVRLKVNSYLTWKT